MDIIVGGLLAIVIYPFIVAWFVKLGDSGRISELERQVAELKRQKQRREQPQTEKEPEFVRDPIDVRSRSYKPVPSSTRVHPSVDAIREKPSSPPPVAASTPRHEIDASSSETVAAPSFTAPDIPPPSPAEPPAWLMTVKSWLLTGNLVAKIGLVILFIGIGFLLKYVAATVVIPIELRLAGVVVADLALLTWGWSLRTTRREIGLPIQGTALAIMMLVIFSAFQRYGLLPGGFAFGLLVALTVFTCLLAVLQNAVWLAAFGIVGGFASPLLTSTGEGSHIALFSYYAVLNAGVFALAIQRSWRALNLLGFAFTFIVGTAWGVLRYSSQDYPSAQGFLLLFFLCYVGISLAFARRQQARLGDYVDATLVLGTPLLAFGLQVGLVKDKPFGLAFSAIALSAFYLLLASMLLRRGRERWGMLVEAFGAFGIIFGTLAVPFALDARWTSAAWALQGAGFVWYGLRRRQRVVWMFGLLQHRPCDP